MLCVRPHAMRLRAAGDGDTPGYHTDGTNYLLGRIVRQTYLGDARDYLIDLGDAQIRVSADPEDDHAVGTRVRMELPVNACRVVVAD